jgi:hypothetical protein
VKALTIAISHNGGKFDNHLLLERLYAKAVPVNLLTTGLKIYTMEVKGTGYRNIVFKDSLNFFHCALDKLPKTFGLSAEESGDKGHFPHFFNRRENLDLQLDELPAFELYGADSMKPEKRAALLEWYEEHRHDPFCLREELLRYCQQDVRILRAACLRFKQIYEELVQVDPWRVASTSAKLALHIFRKEFLQPNMIVNAPEEGYNAAQKQSVIALKYMRLLEEEKGWRIRTREWAVGEASVGDTGLRLDGLVERVRRRGKWKRPLHPIAVEFMGCYWHGRC